MIEIVTQPNQWMSVYEQNKFEFKYYTDVGWFAVYNLGANTNLQFDTFSVGAVALFSVGDTIRFAFGWFLTEHEIIDITGTIVTLGTVFSIALAATNYQVEKLKKDKIQLSLYVGQLTVGIPFTKLADIYVIYRNGVHSVDVRGYLQDYFRNIKVPPVVGYDNELYCNYKLVINDGTDQLIGTVKNSAYSTIQGLNATTHVSAGAALRVGAVEMFNSNPSIYSRINGNTIETLILT